MCMRSLVFKFYKVWDSPLQNVVILLNAALSLGRLCNLLLLDTLFHESLLDSEGSVQFIFTDFMHDTCIIS